MCIYGVRSSFAFLVCASLALCFESSVASHEESKATDKLSPTQPDKVRIETLERLQGTPKEDALQFDRRLLSQVEAACRDDNAKVRAVAVSAFAVICFHREESCPQVLIDCLADQNADVRHMAATYVSVLKHTKASIAHLLTLGDHPDHRIRNAVVSTLIVWKQSTPRVLKALEKATHDPHFGVVHNAHIGLFEVTGKLGPLISYAVSGIEEHASHVQKENVSELSEAERSDSAYRELLAYTCATIVRQEAKKRPRKVAEIIITMLNDPNPIVRRSAARNLGAISTANWKAKRALQAMKADQFLEPLLDDPDESVRHNAAYGQALIRGLVPAIAEKP